MLVKDDARIRLLAVDIVEEAGYIALEASDADEAVVTLEGRSDIALLFTDINMPGSMNGLKLAHAVRNRWPPVTLAAQSMQDHGLISYHRGMMQALDRKGLEKASCGCYGIVKERFDAFLSPPLSAVQGHGKSRREGPADKN
jgi:CheY-like chemotaxis protein